MLLFFNPFYFLRLSLIFSLPQTALVVPQPCCILINALIVWLRINALPKINTNKRT